MPCRLLNHLHSTCSSRVATQWRSSARRNKHTFSPIQSLPDWSLSTFQSQAFNPELPAVLPACSSRHLPAIDLWFEKSSSSLLAGKKLREDTLSPYGDTTVSLELTTTSSSSSGTKDKPSTTNTTFKRFEAPLSLFLAWTAQAQAQAQQTSAPSTQNFYLAQHPLSSLPSALRAHLPVPSLVLTAGRGDIYASNLWLGLSPTYTPLHRDPNPNLLVQIAGRKRVRIFEPEIGRELFEGVKRQGRSRGPGMGEEMMHGVHREVLEREVWGESTEMGSEKGMKKGLEAEIHEGEAFFIPKGWWHSIKGAGEGIVGSVNWWFR